MNEEVVKEINKREIPLNNRFTLVISLTKRFKDYHVVLSLYSIEFDTYAKSIFLELDQAEELANALIEMLKENG
jgi:hypothetical protein